MERERNRKCKRTRKRTQSITKRKKRKKCSTRRDTIGDLYWLCSFIYILEERDHFGQPIIVVVLFRISSEKTVYSLVDEIGYVISVSFFVEFGSFAEKMEFADKDPDPREIISASTVSQQQPSTRTSQSIISSSHPRRSARIAHANCDDSATSSNERRMHRTQSGGVSHRNTSKTNIRRRSTNNRAASTIPSSIDRISTTLNNDLNIDDGIDTNTAPTGSLPSDQSDDDVSLSDTMRQNILSNARSDSNLLTRSEVLSYFDVKQDGFQCKLCKKVTMRLDEKKFQERSGNGARDTIALSLFTPKSDVIPYLDLHMYKDNASFLNKCFF